MDSVPTCLLPGFKNFLPWQASVFAIIYASIVIIKRNKSLPDFLRETPEGMIRDFYLLDIKILRMTIYRAAIIYSQGINSPRRDVTF